MTHALQRMTRVLVTGGAGFIGSHVVDRFLATGAIVVVLDDLSTGRRENLPSDVELLELDIQAPAARDLILRGEFDVVAHLAAQVDVRRSVADPGLDLRVNVAGTINIAEAILALPRDQRPRLVFASTGGALYGDAAVFPTTEHEPVNPDAPYGIDKLAAEYFLAYYSRVWGMDVAALRFGNVYGPRQNPHGEAGVIAIFSQALLEGRPLTVYGSGDQTRDYIYVTDVANAFLAAATQALPVSGALASRAFNVGTAVETSVNEIIGTLSEIAGRTAQVTYAPARSGEVERSVLDPEKAERELGWRAQVSLRDGLAETWHWLAYNGARRSEATSAATRSSAPKAAATQKNLG